MELDLSQWKHLDLTDEESLRIMEELANVPPHADHVEIPQLSRNRNGNVQIGIMSYKRGYYETLRRSGLLQAS